MALFFFRYGYSLSSLFLRKNILAQKITIRAKITAEIQRRAPLISLALKAKFSDTDGNIATAMAKAKAKHKMYIQVRCTALCILSVPFV